MHGVSPVLRHRVCLYQIRCAVLQAERLKSLHKGLGGKLLRAKWRCDKRVTTQGDYK